MGSLRDRYKLILISLFFISAFSLRAYAEAGVLIRSHKELLSLSKEKGFEYKKLKAQFEIDDLNADSLRSFYNWALSGGISQQEAESPPTSPFAPAGESSRQSLNLRLDKQTALGINPFVEVSINDQSLSFPGRGSVEFQTANLEVGFRADLMKVLFTKSSSAVFKEYSLKKEMAKLVRQNFERTFDGVVSKSYFQTLKSYKKLEILTVQCSEYKMLQRISSRRFKKRLIREKDYLSIEVLYQGCLLDKNLAANSFELDKVALLKTSGLPLDSTLIFKDVEFLGALKEKSFKGSDSLDYLLARKTLDASLAYAESKKAGLFPELTFDYSLSSAASEDGVGGSLSEATAFDLKTHNIGLNLKYEFGGSAAKIEAKRSKAEAVKKSLELKQLEQSLVRDDKKLRYQFKFLKEAKLKSLNLVSLQKRKSKLFKKDFENGRGGIRDLVEAQINYLKSLETALNYKHSLTVSKIDRYLLSGEGVEVFN
ncbi:MAG: TolC family protein [Bdellovibrionales bacterium]